MNRTKTELKREEIIHTLETAFSSVEGKVQELPEHCQHPTKMLLMLCRKTLEVYKAGSPEAFSCPITH